MKNHPFIDGNKRTGYVLARLLLMEKQLDILAEQEHKYHFVVSKSTGKLNFHQIKEWFEKNTRYRVDDQRIYQIWNAYLFLPLR